MQQSTLQGEQALSPGLVEAQADEDEHQEATSFISTEQITIVGESNVPTGVEHQSNVHDGSASFIMEYSNNHDLQSSVSNRESAIAGQNLQGGADLQHL